MWLSRLSLLQGKTCVFSTHSVIIYYYKVSDQSQCYSLVLCIFLHSLEGDNGEGDATIFHWQRGRISCIYWHLFSSQCPIRSLTKVSEVVDIILTGHYEHQNRLLITAGLPLWTFQGKYIMHYHPHTNLYMRGRFTFSLCRALAEIRLLKGFMTYFPALQYKKKIFIAYEWER